MPKRKHRLTLSRKTSQKTEKRANSTHARKFVQTAPLGEWHSREARQFSKLREYVRIYMNRDNGRRNGFYLRRQRVQGFEHNKSVRGFNRSSHSFWEAPSGEPSESFRSLYQSYPDESAFPAPIGVVTGWGLRWILFSRVPQNPTENEWRQIERAYKRKYPHAKFSRR